MSVADPEPVAGPSEGWQSFARNNGTANAHANGTSDDANFGRGNYNGGVEANVVDEDRALARAESEKQILAMKVEGLRAQVETLKHAVEARNVLRENQYLRGRVEALTQDCAKWRNCYENSLHYLSVLSPNLAEIAEDDLFQIWKASL